MRIEQGKNAKGKDIYTLVQSGLPIINKLPQLPTVTVKGNGADLSKTKQFHSWAKKKMTTQVMVRRMADIAREMGDFEFAAQCWDTYYCLSSVYISNGRLYSKLGFCKNRHCKVCCGIRKAELINSYAPILITWTDAYHVVLTVKSADLKGFNKRIDEMFYALKRICAKYRKRKGVRLEGVRSLECLFNPVTETYHTHFHIIAKTQEIAEILIMEWCEYWGYTFANPGAQWKREIWNMEGAMIEVIKYSCKVFTEPEYDKYLQGDIHPKIYARAAYHIYTAMKGRRIFDRFGFNLPKFNRQKKATITRLTAYREFFFDPNSADFINEDLDFPLIGHNKDPKLVYLLKYCIDTKLA